MHPIEILPYQDRWPTEFQELASQLWAGLGPLALRIDHIGSTAVPGLGAKDIIDIQVTVASLHPEDVLVEAFQAAGNFVARGSLVEDHRPQGNELPQVEWQKRYFREPQRPGQRRVHIHVRADLAANQRYALLFRDYLRSQSSAAATYEKLKRELSRLYPADRDAYLAVKEPACDLIYLAAEEWAKATGWVASPPDALRGASA